MWAKQGLEEAERKQNVINSTIPPLSREGSAAAITSAKNQQRNIILAF